MDITDFETKLKLQACCKKPFLLTHPRGICLVWECDHSHYAEDETLPLQEEGLQIVCYCCISVVDDLDPASSTSNPWTPHRLGDLMARKWWLDGAGPCLLFPIGPD